jgi:hypothetical protein
VRFKEAPTKRIGGRKLTWPDRVFYFIVFALLAWAMFEVRA